MLISASAVQVSDAGELVEVSDDVLGIARDLREIDPSLHLRYSEKQDIWIVFQLENHPITGEELKKQLVTTSQTLNPEIVERVRKITSDSYDLVGELEQIEKQKKRDARHALRESLGEKGEKLAWALRKDTHRDQRRIFVPNGLPAA
jgi:hypothetical protein